MQQDEPYYAADTNGVHFEVCVDGDYVQAYVAGKVLASAYGQMAPGAECVSAYRANRAAIDPSCCAGCAPKAGTRSCFA